MALFAAVDTSSAVMGWNLFHVARCEEVQEKLLAELQSAVAKSGKDRRLTAEALSRENVPYLHAIFRETHRLTPPGPIAVTKQVDKDGIKVNNVELKKGDVISLEVFTTGMDPELVDNPNEYKPERWLSDAVEARKGTASEILDHLFLKGPFSQGMCTIAHFVGCFWLSSLSIGFCKCVGARKCPGARVATNEMHVLLAQLVLDWKMSSPVKELENASYVQRTMIEVQMPELQFEART